MNKIIQKSHIICYVLNADIKQYLRIYLFIFELRNLCNNSYIVILSFFKSYTNKIKNIN